jgi:hypothetical protein
MSRYTRTLLRSILPVALSAAVLLCGEIIGRAEFALSRATNEMYVGVCGNAAVSFQDASWLTNSAPVPYDDRLMLFLFCRTGHVAVLLASDPSYSVNFEMQGPNGKTVPKTAAGRRWGSRGKDFSDGYPGHSKARFGSFSADGPHGDGFAKYAPGPLLPAPKDLFQMEVPGIYSLTLEVHLMKQITNTNVWTWEPLAIPRVTVRVEKPPSNRDASSPVPATRAKP